MRTSRTTPRSLLGVAAALVLAAGCGGSPEQAGTETAPADAPAETDDTAADPDEEATDQRTDDDGGSEDVVDDDPGGDQQAEDGESGTSLASGGTAVEMEPVALDLADRHPMGVVVEVHELRTDGNQVLLDVDIINGASRRVVIQATSYSSQSIRLVDDLGGTYGLHATDEERDVLRNVAAGENVSGTLAFYGPLDRNAQELELVINLSDTERADFDPQDPEKRPDGLFPTFVIGPIELQADR